MCMFYLQVRRPNENSFTTSLLHLDPRKTTHEEQEIVDDNTNPANGMGVSRVPDNVCPIISAKSTPLCTASPSSYRALPSTFSDIRERFSQFAAPICSIGEIIIGHQ